MGKTLVLAEKPSVGKDIARALGIRGGGMGSVEGGNYVVTWALGHLVELAEPELYDERYKKWDISHLPIMPEKLKTAVIPQTSKQYAVVKGLLNRADVSNVVIATDAGREGELVARWIIEKAGCKKPIQRLWISSVTEKAIKDGFRDLRDGKRYEPLADSARARAEADWLVGINATRCMTTRFNAQLSCGRVQTPTLAIIASREEEIRAFVPRPFFGLSAKTQPGFTLTWADAEGNTRTFDRAKAEAVFAKIQNEKAAVVKQVTKQAGKKNPPHLYDLTELQMDASKRYALSPKETLAAAQSLYERHKALTYPRTDSRHLPQDVAPTLAERVRAVSGGPFRAACANLLKYPLKPAPGVIDDKKVSDHHALIPTEQAVNLSDLDARERRIYDLVVTRFLTVFYPPMEFEKVVIRAGIGSETFTARGRVVTKPGWTQLAGDLDDEDDKPKDAEDATPEQKLPPLKNGDKINIANIKITEGKTKPPPPFTEATLLSAMENPAKYLEAQNARLEKTLKETGGLGTVATRADIIEKLYTTFVVEKNGASLYTTAKGRQLLNLVPPTLKSPALTGEWERKLQMIAEGKLKKETFVTEIRGYARGIIDDIKASTDTYKHDNLTTKQCPICGGFMLEVAGKKGKMLVCQDRSCEGRVNVSFSTRARCPRCHKFLDVVGENEKRKAVCPGCGYNERYEAFEKRMSEANDRVSDSQAAAMLSKLNADRAKEAPNNPFAALKGLDLKKEPNARKK